MTQVASGVITRNVPRMYVLAIGVDKYRMDAYRLNYAVKDAKEFAAALKTVGEGLFGSVHTTVLTDEDVAESRIASAIDRIAAESKPHDVFVLFLGGHGKSIEGKYYYLPQTLDFKGEQPLTEGGIGQEKWQEWLARRHCLSSTPATVVQPGRSFVGWTPAARRPWSNCNMPPDKT